MRTKQDLDIDLVKCFNLGENDALNGLIEEAAAG
jgi:hypothetical protein